MLLLRRDWDYEECGRGQSRPPFFVLLAPAAARAPSGSDTQARYDMQTFGTFRKLILESDFTQKATFGVAIARHPTTGVDALADARGEIAIHDGKPIVSYGKNASSCP